MSVISSSYFVLNLTENIVFHYYMSKNCTIKKEKKNTHGQTVCMCMCECVFLALAFTNGGIIESELGLRMDLL